VEHYNNVRLNSATGYITPKDVLTRRQQEIHAESDRKLEADRRQTPESPPASRVKSKRTPPCRTAVEVDSFRFVGGSRKNIWTTGIRAGRMALEIGMRAGPYDYEYEFCFTVAEPMRASNP
jgi:hypothetical protein